MQRKYAGTWTAIITPFKKDGSIDEMALRKIVRRQIENGVTGVVPVGTTGESPSTTAAEDGRIFQIVVDEVKKAAAEGLPKIMVMAGTGSNCTAEAIDHTEQAKRAGVDCCLVVAPYYNKPTPKGLKLHYAAIADLGLPIIVYNIKGRTAVNIDTNTLMAIAKHPMIVGVKEASGDLAQIKEVLTRRVALESDTGKEFSVFSGDDGLTLEVMKMGGDGVISVASNLVPKEMSDMVKLAAAGNYEEAQKANDKLARLFKDIFMETNPIPVKYMASRIGLCELAYRLPMCEPEEKTMAALDETLKFYGLVK